MTDGLDLLEGGLTMDVDAALQVLDVMASAIPGAWHLTAMEQACVRSAIGEIARLRDVIRRSRVSMEAMGSALTQADIIFGNAYEALREAGDRPGPPGNNGHD